MSSSLRFRDTTAYEQVQIAQEREEKGDNLMKNDARLKKFLTTALNQMRQEVWERDRVAEHTGLLAQWFFPDAFIAKIAESGRSIFFPNEIDQETIDTELGIILGSPARLNGTSIAPYVPDIVDGIARGILECEEDKAPERAKKIKDRADKAAEKAIEKAEKEAKRLADREAGRGISRSSSVSGRAPSVRSSVAASDTGDTDPRLVRVSELTDLFETSEFFCPFCKQSKGGHTPKNRKALDRHIGTKEHAKSIGPIERTGSTHLYHALLQRFNAKWRGTNQEGGQDGQSEVASADNAGAGILGNSPVRTSNFPAPTIPPLRLPTAPSSAPVFNPIAHHVVHHTSHTVRPSIPAALSYLEQPSQPAQYHALPPTSHPPTFSSQYQSRNTFHLYEGHARTAEAYSRTTRPPTTVETPLPAPLPPFQGYNPARFPSTQPLRALQHSTMAGNCLRGVDMVQWLTEAMICRHLAPHTIHRSLDTDIRSLTLHTDHINLGN
ncbi:hypothetical protein BJ508DRAFT_332826 [Ascobolus immersus RN42]|uniref:Uncharacterized protein n=1 Tax=Ascobolus immersus RN42 TaxID=1160509 RepID=A0A3N4HSB1_ASCIM|nr:hypothetical protein BJ508DRAFT_332826 [Ascobolus immersus RN42]